MTKLTVPFHNFANAPKTKCVTVMGYLQLVTWGCLRTYRRFSLGYNFETFLLLCIKECKISKNCCYDYKTRTEDPAMHTKRESDCLRSPWLGKEAKVENWNWERKMVLVCCYFNKYVNFGPYCEVRVVTLLDFVILECIAITGTG